MTTPADLTGARLPSVVLWEPGDPINVGSVVRACMLCDAPDLRLVRPRYADGERVLISAPHGAAFVRDHTRVVDSWEQAVEGKQRLIAFTARGRNKHKRPLSVAEVAEQVVAEPRPTAFVFGREDHGLPNEVVDRCDGYVTLAASPSFRSFNLAQAVMVALHRVYEYASGSAARADATAARARADQAAVERMMRTAEAGMDAIGFFKGDQRTNVLRTVRATLLRAEVDDQELATFWALFADLERIGPLVDGAGTR